MARTAVPASTLGASNIGTVVAQKTPIVSTVEGFAAFVESAQERLPQKRGLSPVPTPSLHDQPVPPRSRSVTGQDPQPAAGGLSAGNQEAVDRPDAPAQAVALLPVTPDPSKPTAKQTTSPQGSHPAKGLCENPKTPADSAATATSTPIVAPAATAAADASAAVLSPAPAAPPDTAPAIASSPVAAAAEQATGPVSAGRNSLSVDGGSASGDETPNATPTVSPNAAFPPPNDPLTTRPAANGSPPAAGARPSAKVVTDRPDTPAIASPDTLRFQDGGIAPAPTPAQPAAISETSAQAAVAPTISANTANTAMAEANRAVALRVSRAIASGEDTLTIELHPAELGHVAVHLAFHDSGVQVQMVVGRQETFQAFSQDRAALEQQFSQAGIDLGAGGLDLRYSQTPEPRQAYASGSSSPEAGSSQAQTSNIFSSDNLVNIVA